VAERGAQKLDVQESRSDATARTEHALDLRGLGEAWRARKPARRLRRRRTC
jgi:hypothetical protein